MQSHKYPAADQYQSLNGSVEPEIEVRKPPQVESSRDVEYLPTQNEYPPRRVEPLHDEIEVRKEPQVESSREWHQQQPPTHYPPPQDAGIPRYGQTHEQDVKPMTSVIQHSAPEPPPQQQQEQPPSRPTTTTHVRTIGTRSWNDFESSRRKKSMELLDSRPVARPYESKERPKGEVDFYKLKRPADYIPKHKTDQGESVMSRL